MKNRHVGMRGDGGEDCRLGTTLKKLQHIAALTMQEVVFFRGSIKNQYSKEAIGRSGAAVVSMYKKNKHLLV